MLILGISCGYPEGSCDMLCKEALMGAQEAGAEIMFIRLGDLMIKPCNGCHLCRAKYKEGRASVCEMKDDFSRLREQIKEADGIIIVDPVYHVGSSGLFHIFSERVAMDWDLHGGKNVSYMGTSISDWECCSRSDHAIQAQLAGWKIIDNECFSQATDLLVNENKMARAHQIGVTQVLASKNCEMAKYQGGEGVCPHCHGEHFAVIPGTNQVTCCTCGIEGELELVDGKLKFIYPQDREARAHDMPIGKAMREEVLDMCYERMTEVTHSEEYAVRTRRYQEFDV